MVGFVRVAAIALVVCLPVSAASASVPSSGTAPTLDPNASLKATFVTETKKVLLAGQALRNSLRPRPSTLLAWPTTVVALKLAAGTLRTRARAAEAALRAEKPTALPYRQARAAAISAMVLLGRAAAAYSSFATDLARLPLVTYDGRGEEWERRLLAMARTAQKLMDKAKVALRRAIARLGNPPAGAALNQAVPKPLPASIPVTASWTLVDVDRSRVKREICGPAPDGCKNSFAHTGTMTTAGVYTQTHFQLAKRRDPSAGVITKATFTVKFTPPPKTLKPGAPFPMQATAQSKGFVNSGAQGLVFFYRASTGAFLKDEREKENKGQPQADSPQARLRLDLTTFPGETSIAPILVAPSASSGTFTIAAIGLNFSSITWTYKIKPST